MRISGDFCDLCGANMETSRTNGWAGNLSVKGNGNFHVYGFKEDLSACCSCGKSIVTHIKSLKRDFKFKIVKEKL